MAASDKLLGSAMLAVAAFVFVYYTIWALFLPFLDPTSTLHDWFPAREWAVRLPAALLLLGVTGIALFFARVSMAEARKRARAEKKA
ncbi:dolichol phosphate-mannose biosynthesis regulatory [Papiliotrema laurentii]|uniref:Dolichol phosphate-mannose biosynthesis regulatory protein n=1 Tax=Papiliotrema laurentii TaxID=5418 RepID=A0AAD9FQ31_PAPLA|nr:dolichol phosphate-mannose biosynthesis regulatory [Papiliotrema laurentii]